MTKCLELTFILDSSIYSFSQHFVSSHIVCCASNHQSNIEMAQGHISLSISPFLVIYANTLKSNSFWTNISRRAQKSKFMSNWRPIRLLLNLAYLDHFCHHLVCFLKTNSFSYHYVKHTCFGESRDLSRLNLIKCQKLPLFPYSNFFPTRE
jgi:hypothetical protein